jgi:membrane fusion protein (multidrug efflux system)
MKSTVEKVRSGDRKRELLTALLSALVIAASGGCGKADGSAPGPAADGGALAVRVTRPLRQEVVRRVVLPATVRADLEVTLYAKVTGYLKEITKDRGDKVKAGERVALLEIPEMVSEIAHAKASYELEDATLRRLEAIRKVEKTAVTDQDLDLARAKRDMAKATLKKLETLHESTEIRAPFAGTVTERFVDPGAFIQQGKIVSIVDTSKVRVLVDVPESEVRFAAVGTEAEVQFDALPGKKYKAAISRSADSLDPVMRTMRVEVDVKNEDASVYPGMFARVAFGVDRRAQALVIPSAAVTFQQDKAIVWVEVGGLAKKIPVLLGVDSGQYYEVLKGLSGEESVILPEGKALLDGTPVHPEAASERGANSPTEHAQTAPSRTAERDPR